MFIADYIESSLLDWEGKIACVVFLSGCNFRCPWCHNKELAEGTVRNIISVDEILQKLKDKKNWIDGFVITGGEPTINKGLIEIISKINDYGFPVKIDTNGSMPTIIKELIERKLVDSISMDIKSSLTKEKYNNACGVEVNLSDINHTIEILLNSNIEVSFRTTAVPGIVDGGDIKKIFERIKGIKYIVQKFVPHNTLDKSYMNVKPYSDEDMKKMPAWR